MFAQRATHLTRARAFPRLPPSLLSKRGVPTSCERNSKAQRCQIRRDESLLMNAHLNAPDVHKTITSEKEGGYSILNIQGVVGIQGRMSTAIGVARKRGQRRCSRIGSGPRVGAHVEKSSNVLKQTRTQLTQDVRGGVHSRHPKNPLQTSAGKPSSSTPAQLPETVVIDDSEPGPQDDDDN